MQRVPRLRCTVFLLGLLSVSAAAQTPKEVKTYFFDPDQIGQGQTLKFHIAGDKFTDIKEVRFEPPAGITVASIREIDVMRKARRWEVEIATAADAPLGKRNVTAVTAEGVIKKKVEVVAAKVPIISDVKMVQASAGQYATVLHFTFNAVHAEGALGKKQELALGVASSGFQLLPGFTYYKVFTDKVEPVDATHSLVAVRWAPLGRTFAPGLVVRVAMKDNKNWSNMLEEVAAFQ